MKTSATTQVLCHLLFLLLTSCETGIIIIQLYIHYFSESSECSFHAILAKLLNFTLTKDVVEGEYANFSCTVKRGKGVVLWKIGNYTIEEGESFDYPADNTVSVKVYQEDDPELAQVFAGIGQTTRIGILATPKLNRVPVQCVMIPNSGHTRREYSMFAILNVLPAPSQISGILI